jgi:transglutaminase-like putative cysteine protease
MVRMSFSIQLLYRIEHQPGDFIFNVHAAHTPLQVVVSENLQLTPFAATGVETDPATGSRFVRLRADPGELRLRYDATVDIAHHLEAPGNLAEVPVSRLPLAVLPYLYPSRYCQSDRLYALANAEFGHLPPGYGRVQAINDWVQGRTQFMSASSNSSTSAIDTIDSRVGVCRDFAHLMIALCRASNIPARFVTGIDYGADPALGPTDFHAYVEAWLGDRWYLFDPTGVVPRTGLVRIGTGRDAADVSFATIFGAVTSGAPLISIEALDDPQNGYAPPQVYAEALSTHG